MQTIQSIQLKEANVKEYSSARLLPFLKRHFLKSRYSLDSQHLSDSDLSSLLVYFAISYLQQNGSFKARLDGINKNEILSLSNYLFGSLKLFLPEEIASVMPAPNMASLEQARLFYEESVFGNSRRELFFRDIANLGFAYQIFSLGLRNKDALVAVQSANKQISRQQLISFTQLYTPTWVVDFILANSALPRFGKWEEKFPLRYANWLAKKNLPLSGTSSDLENFSLLDPACGAGQFLFSAFDLLSSLSESVGYSKEESVNLALKNMHGADIDKKALWVAALGLLCQSWRNTGNVPSQSPNLIWSEKEGEAGFLGSIDRSWSKEHALGRSYDTVVINPPYLGRKCLSRELKTSLQEQYPGSSSDICAAFLKRGAEMLKPNGRLGVITQSSLLSIPSYKPLRDYLFSNYFLETIVRCGPGIFPLASGEKIDSVLLIAEAPTADFGKIQQTQTKLYDLTSEKDKSNKLKEILKTSSRNKNNEQQATTLKPNFQNIKLADGLPFGLPYQLLDKFNSFAKLGDIADIRQGLATTDNARFVRYSFDVDPQSIGSLWIPYVKGAGAEQFASENPFVVKWGDKGEEIKKAVKEAYPYLKGKTAWVVKNEEFYFRPGLCFSFINKSGLAVRRLPAGTIFDVGSSAIFAKPEDEDFLLAYLNSSLLGLLAKTINQTINVQVGDLKKLPVFSFPPQLKDQLAKLGHECFLAKQRLLQLQHIHISGARKNTLISDKDLEISFHEHINEQTTLSLQLQDLQKRIDHLILGGLKQLNILTQEEEIYLQNACLLDTIRHNKNTYIFDAKLAAFKIIGSLTAKLLSDESGNESLKLVRKQELIGALTLSECGKQWLEDKIDRSLEQMFYRPAINNYKTKVLDISRLAGEPSRYFSLGFENVVLFFSAVAASRTMKLSETENRINTIWQPIGQQLSLIGDWTSKDLLSLANSITDKL